MASERRLQKLDQVLREEIAKILDREIEFPAEMIVTVTRLSVSPDARIASAFVSILGGDGKTALEILAKNVYHIQQLLNRRLPIRPVPKIHFAIDEEEMKREGVEKSLAELKRKKEI